MGAMGAAGSSGARGVDVSDGPKGNANCIDGRITRSAADGQVALSDNYRPLPPVHCPTA